MLRLADVEIEAGSEDDDLIVVVLVELLLTIDVALEEGAASTRVLGIICS